MARDQGLTAASKSRGEEFQDDIDRLAPGATLAIWIGLSAVGWLAIAGLVLMFI